MCFLIARAQGIPGVQGLVRAIVATVDAKIIFQSDNEAAILELKRQAAAECLPCYTRNDSDPQ